MPRAISIDQDPLTCRTEVWVRDGRDARDTRISEYKSEDKNHYLDIHRLIQLVTRKWLVRKNTMKYFAGQALLTVSHNYPFGDFKNRVTCSAYLPHVCAVLNFEDTGSRDEGLANASLLHNTAGFFSSQG